MRRRRVHGFSVEPLSERNHSDGVIGDPMSLCRCRPSLPRCLRHVVRTQHRKQHRGHCQRPEATQSRRTALTSVGILACSELLRVASADEITPAKRTPAAGVDNGTKVLRSAAGFEFVYPATWLVAFERGESTKEGTIAFVGNFLTIDTFSVEKVQLTPATTAGSSTDLRSLAEEMVKPVQESPSSIAFEVLDGSYRDTAQGPSSVYVLEYSVDTCKGLVTEGLGGKKSCKDAKDNELTTVPRHHLLGVTMTPDALYYLRASCPTPRWDAAKSDLWMALNSFVAYKSRSETSE